MKEKDRFWVDLQWHGDPEPEPAPEPEKPEPDPKPEPESVDDKIKAAVTAAIDGVKGEIAGLNRKNTELETELESEKKAHMTDSKRLEYEREQKDTALAEREQRVTELERNNRITDGLATAGLDLSAKELMVIPSTDEDVAAWVARQMTFINAEVEKRVAEALTTGPKPKGSPGPTLVKDFDSKTIGSATEAEAIDYLAKIIGD